MSPRSGRRQKAAFYAEVDKEFYAEATASNGGKLPADLTDSNGNPRPLTMSRKDRAYRKKWLATAARLKNSKAHDQPLGSSVPCSSKSGASTAPSDNPAAIPGAQRQNSYASSVTPAEPATTPSTVKNQEQSKPCRNKDLDVKCEHGMRQFSLHIPTDPTFVGPVIFTMEVVGKGHDKITCKTSTPCTCDEHQGKVFDVTPDESVASKSDSQLAFEADSPHLPTDQPWSMFWPQNVNTLSYAITTSTCETGTATAHIVSYPMISWDAGLSLSYQGSQHGEGMSDSTTPYDGIVSQDDFWDEESSPKKKVTFKGHIKAQFNDYSFSCETGGDSFIDGIKDFIYVLYRIDDLCSNDIIRKLNVVSTSVQWPNLTLNGAWGWEELSQSPLCGLKLDLGLALSPLIGIQLDVDILVALLNLCDGLGVFISWLRSIIKDYVDFGVDFTITGTIAGKCSLSGYYPDFTVDGSVTDKIDFKLDAHANVEGHCVVGGKVGVDGGGDTSLSGDLKPGVDSTGHYLEGSISFDGLVFWLHAYCEGGIKFTFWGVDVDADVEVGDWDKHWPVLDKNTLLQGSKLYIVHNHSQSDTSGN